MTTIHAARAFTARGWRSDIRLGIADGVIAWLSEGAAQAGDQRCQILLPAMPNLHSHAFQRGMAGLAELRGPGVDTFWSWRETMYRFALEMTPEEVEAIAAQLYVEMLEGGFARVAEFHYLHHDRDGRPYGGIATMAEAVISAARDAGIGLTLLPVFYAHSSFGGAPPSEGQRRFVNDPDQFRRLVEACRAAIALDPASVLGVAAHSLRAATPEELSMAAALCPEAPFHIHAAEQMKEVEDCVAWFGRRPVEFLLDAAEVDARWCLVHATHMTAQETARLARSGAVAGLCPVTEANLGDGVFPGPGFVEAGGRFGVGSDSNVLIGVAAELRQLEYAQRLWRRERNVLARANASTGRALFEAALCGGARAAGRPAPRIAAGAQADLVSLDADHPALLARSGDAILDGWIFGASRPAVDSVWVAGSKQVEAGRHRRRETVRRRFAAAVDALAAPAVASPNHRRDAMNRRFLLTALLGAGIVLAAPLAARAEDALARVKSAGALKVGTETAFAPFDFIDVTGAHVGLNVDLFNQIGKELGVKIDWVTLPWDGVLPALEAGQFDMVAGPATITKARAERYRFLSPVADATVALLKRKGDDSIHKPADIAGKLVGGGKATAQLAQVQEYGKTLPGGIKTREYVGFNEAYADLAAGRVAAVANSLPNIAFVAKEKPDAFALVLPPFGTPSYFGYIGSKRPDDQKLLDAVNAAILKIKQDGRMDALQKKWFGTTFKTPDEVPAPKV